MQKTLFLLTALVCSLISTASNDYYHLMTADSTLRDGDKIVFYSPTQEKASGSRISTEKYISGIEATLKNGELVIADSHPITIKANGSYWNLYLDDKGIGHASTTDNSVDFKSGTTTDFAITISQDNWAVVKSQTGSTKYPQFYCNGNGNFRLYNSTSMSPIQIYRKVAQPSVPVAVESVTLDQHNLRMRVGDEQTLEATIEPEEAANKAITWTALQGNVLVSETGVVTALSEGTDTVVVTTTDDNKKDSCIIEVLPAAQTVTWNHVQYIDSLKDGVRVFIGTPAKDYIVGLYEKGSNIKGVAASYSDDRHSVTASDEYAYTIQRDGDKIIFVGSDGKYLYMYNTNKNLSSSSTLNNQAKWTATIDSRYGQAMIANTYSSSWHIFFNKTASPALFCTYTTQPATDANIAYVYLYSDNAPEWQEYVLQPEWTLLCGEDTITNVLDFGKVEFDDSWGTETNPYEAAKTLKFVTKDLEDQTFQLSLKTGSVFQLITSSVPGKGGTASIQFSTDKKGHYEDSLYITLAGETYGILLKADAVDVEEVKPKLTLSTRSIYLNPNINNSMSDMAELTFSVENLTKALYIKWEKGEIPDWTTDEVTIYAGNEAADVYFGSATNMGTDTRTNESILIEASAYEVGTFVSTLCFYSYLNKEELAFEERVTITITIAPDYNPTTDLDGIIDNHNANSTNTTLRRFNVLGQEVDAHYKGLVIDGNQKRIQR